MKKISCLLVSLLGLTFMLLPRESRAETPPSALPGTTELITRSLSGGEPSGSSDHPQVSADGRFVAFSSMANDLHPDDSDSLLDIYRYDRQTRQLSLVSVSTSGVKGNDDSGGFAMSADGNRFVFESLATNLVDGKTTSGTNVFLRDFEAGITRLLSHGQDGSPADDDSGLVAISPDGLYVTFASRATNLMAGDNNFNCDLTGYPGGDWNCWDVFLYEVMSDTLTIVSRADGLTFVPGDGASRQSAVSNGGAFIAFTSRATNLTTDSPTTGVQNIFLRSRSGDRTFLISRPSGSTSPANNDSYDPAISTDGEHLVFASNASNLLSVDTVRNCDSQGYPGGSDNCSDVFFFDLTSMSLRLVSSGPGGTPGNGGSYFPSISGDGKTVAFESLASNLVTGDTYDLCVGGRNCRDVFFHDLEAGATYLASVANDGSQAEGTSYSAFASQDGSLIAFASHAQNLVQPSDHGTAADIFLRRRLLPVSGTLQPGSEFTLVFTDTAGLPTTLDFPSGSVVAEAQVVLTPTIETAPPGLSFAGHAFNLALTQAGLPAQPLQPVTVTIHYSDADLAAVGDERLLDLYLWQPAGWVPAGSACDPPQTTVIDAANNLLQATLCHFSRLAMFGSGPRALYLPLTLR